MLVNDALHSEMAKRVAGFGTTVFVEINELARLHAAVISAKAHRISTVRRKFLPLRYEQ